MTPGIAVAGNLIVDRHLALDTYPAESRLATITSVDSSPGGLAHNCAVDLARLDPTLPVTVFGRVGEDELGDEVLACLARHPGIDASHVVRAGVTSFTEVMENPRRATRTFFHFRGANAHFCAADVRLDAAAFDVLHVGYALLLDALDQPDEACGTRLAALLKAAQEAGIATSLDAVSEESDRFAALVPPALAYTDVCCLNELEAGRTTGIVVDPEAPGFRADDLRPVAERLLDLGVGRWALVHWAGGAVGLDREGTWCAAPAVRLAPDDVVGTTGAGDAFAAGVLVAFHRGRPLDEALCAGLGAAAASVQHRTATDGVCTYEAALALQAGHSCAP